MPQPERHEMLVLGSGAGSKLLACQMAKSGHRAGGDGRSVATAARICWKRPRGTATSAIWKITERPCPTIRAPIFTSRLR